MEAKLEALKELLACGDFHHATYRNMGTIWEGLWIYCKYDGARGFYPAMCFGKDHAELHAAEDLIRHTGISVGSYGRG